MQKEKSKVALSILVTGGAGYIGSHMVKMLDGAGFRTTAFDNLSRGHRDAVASGDFVKGDLQNPEELKKLFGAYHFDAVMHFAAFCYVGESVQSPLSYYRNNVAGTLNLLDAMKSAGIDKFVFSSSCATYGIPKKIPITEDEPQNPINPYGQTKLMVERILKDSAKAYKINSIALRYFNAAGCAPDGTHGERHEPETHLIPLVLLEAKRVLRGGNPQDTMLRVFGDDFDTPDGTCIRDYVHVQDLCAAHMSAMKRLLDQKSEGFEAYNLGNGQGFSVKQVIDTCRKITGADIKYRIVDRRQGDPVQLVGSAEKARTFLEWKPRINTLETIIETAWRWLAANP
jgi:UDP-glucose-4-epimerase GalE